MLLFCTFRFPPIYFSLNILNVWTHRHKNVLFLFLNNPDWHIWKEKLLGQNLWVNDSRLFYKRLSVCMCVFCMDGWTQCVWWPVTMVAQSHRISSKSERGKGGGERRRLTGEERKWKRHRWDGTGMPRKVKKFKAKTLTKLCMVGANILHIRHWSSLHHNSRV